MNKTVNVNIGGMAFTIDEDAHSILSDYFHQIESRLSPMERVEIMEDVENRVADIFSQRLNVRIQVVGVAMVRDAIATIGYAEDFGEPQSETPNEKSTSKKNHRVGDFGFVRSVKDRKLAGICGGLAPILNVDVTIIRLILVIAAFVSASILFWVYIILWIIVPEETESSINNKSENERG